MATWRQPTCPAKTVLQFHTTNEPPPPVICRTKYIPLPSSIDLLPLIPITLFGLGRGVASPNCFVGLPASCLVGLSPPPVSCRKIPESPPLRPVNWRAMVVVPVSCGATNGPFPVLRPVYDGMSGLRGGSTWTLLKCNGSRSLSNRRESPLGGTENAQYSQDILCTIRRLVYHASQQNLVSYHILAVIYSAYPSLCPFLHRPNKRHAISIPEDQGRHPSPSERPPSGIQGKQPSYRIEKMTKVMLSAEVAVHIEKMNIGYFHAGANL